MKGFLIFVLMAAAIMAVAVPTNAIASQNYDYDTTMSLDCVDAVAINADDSGGSLFAESAVAATALDKYREEVACRPLRALIRGIGRGVIGIGRGLSVGRYRGNSC